MQYYGVPQQAYGGYQQQAYGGYQAYGGAGAGGYHGYAVAQPQARAAAGGARAAAPVDAGARHGVPMSPVPVKSTPANNDAFMSGSEKAVRMEYDAETKKWKKFATVLKLERRPFAVGSMRSAYMMKDLTEGETGKEYVAKLSNDPNDQKYIYYEDVAMQMEAQEFAKKFNKRFGKKVVEFLVAYVAELVERPGKPLIGIEQRIHGNYVKYNNNWDWTDERRNTPQAFSHFSWEESGHRILICDVQGVGDMWTDPQVHSSDGKGYGKGNMGMRGINAFLKNHRCNAICKALKLPQIGKPAKSMYEGTCLKPAELKREAVEEELGLTSTQRRAEKVSKDLHVPPVVKGAVKQEVRELDRLVVQVCSARGLPEGTDSMVVVTLLPSVSAQSGETRVVYSNANPEWQQRFQMSLDKSVEHLVAVVYDWSDTEETGGEPAVLATARVPFSELKDDAGFDEREWPLTDYASSRPMAATLLLKILRYANTPKIPAAVPAAADAGALRGLDDAAHKKRIFSNMQGVKVMIKEVVRPPLASAGETTRPPPCPQGGGEPLPLFAFVRIDNCEAKTRPTPPAFGTSQGATVEWNQKMAFPACAANSVMHVQILCQPAGNAAPIPVAKQAIKIEELPWNSEGQVPGVLVNLEDLTDASGLMRWFNPNGAVDKAKQAPALHIQAWVLTPVPNANQAPNANGNAAAGPRGGEPGHLLSPPRPAHRGDAQQQTPLRGGTPADPAKRAADPTKGGTVSC